MEGSKIYDPRQQIVESLSDDAIAARFNHFFGSFSQTDWGRPEWRKSHQKVVFFLLWEFTIPCTHGGKSIYQPLLILPDGTKWYLEALLARSSHTRTEKWVCPALVNEFCNGRIHRPFYHSCNASLSIFETNVNCQHHSKPIYVPGSKLPFTS